MTRGSKFWFTGFIAGQRLFLEGSKLVFAVWHCFVSILRGRNDFLRHAAP